MMLYTQFSVYLQHRRFLCMLRRQLALPQRETRAEALQAMVSLGDCKGLRLACRSPDSWIRAEAVKGLARLQGVKSTRNLVRMLADKDQRVVHAAAECLAHIEDPRVVWALRRCVVAEDWLVRFFGTTGLVRIGSPDVLPLLEELQNDAHP